MQLIPGFTKSYNSFRWLEQIVKVQASYTFYVISGWTAWVFIKFDYKISAHGIYMQKKNQFEQYLKPLQRIGMRSEKKKENTTLISYFFTDFLNNLNNNEIKYYLYCLKYCLYYYYYYYY